MPELQTGTASGLHRRLKQWIVADLEIAIAYPRKWKRSAALCEHAVDSIPADAGTQALGEVVG
jgi:hypothetical protein